jgi:hypothetical protein
VKGSGDLDQPNGIDKSVLVTAIPRPDGPLGILEHQGFELALRPFVVKKCGPYLTVLVSAEKKFWRCVQCGLAAEPNWRILGDPPSVGADFDATPKLIHRSR